MKPFDHKTYQDIPLHKTLHLIGIGGSGMSALAKIALEKGYKVTGSELKETIATIKLKDNGATVFLKHKASNLRKADVVVVSSAIPEDNIEVVAAKKDNIPILKRAELLQILMMPHPKKLCVAGTHGKTTTSSMMTRVLDAAHMSPTFVIGGELKNYGFNSALGTGDYFVAEADESDGSFLYLTPDIGILTNIECEHLDFYKSITNIKDHFLTFMTRILAKNGHLILNADDPIIQQIAPASAHIIWYGINSPAKIMAKNITCSEEGTQFVLYIDNQNHGEITLTVYGHHNVANALAVIACALSQDIPLDAIKAGLYDFLGTKRRFQFIGTHHDIKIYDDYGHHPTEIKATLDGARASFDARIICIFQPHRYTRTRDLLDLFSDAFSSADKVIITEVYAANEEKIYNVSGKSIVEKMIQKGIKTVKFVKKKSDIPTLLLPDLRPGDLIITMGAGDIHTCAKEILAQLSTSKESRHS